MNKKTIAIAALALLATSGVASARTIHLLRTNKISQSDTVVSRRGGPGVSPHDVRDGVNGGGENISSVPPGHSGIDIED